MDNGRTPVVNKLILLVLVGICVCLMVLIAQNRRHNLADQSTAPVVTMTQDNTAGADRWDAEPPVRLRVTNNLPRPKPTVTASVQRQQSAPEILAPQETRVQDVASAPVEAVRVLEAPVVTSVSGTPVGRVEGSSTYAAGMPIFGRVVLSGKPPPEILIAMDPTCGKLHDKPVRTRHYVVGQEGGLANVWVYAQNVGGKFSAPTQQLVLDQIGCLYEPYVFGVMVEQPVLIRNSDPVLHNINTTASRNAANRFNIAQPSQGKEDVKVFGKPELGIKFMCNVHPWMLSYGGVFEHPFFAVTDSEGRFEIPPGLPQGRYILAARHLKAGETLHEIVLQEGSPATPLEMVLKVPSH